MLWDRLGSEPNITRRDGFSVESLLRDDGGRVIGLTGKTKDGPEEWFTAPWVVGADGRFSTIARRVDAKTVEEQTEKVSTVYFADWVGFTPRVPGKDLVEVYSTGRGMNVLCFPLSGGRVTVCIHIRADRVDIEGDAEAWYRAKLQSIPAIAARLSGARTVSRVLGLKRVGNGYREAGGPGWVLTGDALHYKDPVDGQGIYDALIETKILAEELEAGFAGKAPEAVLAAYTERTRAATHAMYAATQKRLADELYSEPPVPVIRTMIRWMLTDRAYQVRFIRFLTRDLDPATWIGPGLVAGAVLRGIGRDLRSLFVKQPKALPGPA
jgi:2-polyprenyl-6-methoxyphenol hydroxylase-like FAD-dependent oxidoreductase